MELVQRFSAPSAALAAVTAAITLDGPPCQLFVLRQLSPTRSCYYCKPSLTCATSCCQMEQGCVNVSSKALTADCDAGHRPEIRFVKCHLK